ncbi:MAG: hypothetical protein WA901_03110, partial [Phormidesmis sp.]
PAVRICLMRKVLVIAVKSDKPEKSEPKKISRGVSLLYDVAFEVLISRRLIEIFEGDVRLIPGIYARTSR